MQYISLTYNGKTLEIEVSNEEIKQIVYSKKNDRFIKLGRFYYNLDMIENFEFIENPRQSCNFHHTPPPPPPSNFRMRYKK